VIQVTQAHLAHDPEVLAGYASGDLAGRERATANALLAACLACAALVRDLRAIACALPLLARPRRTRDFRLSASEAARLRRFAWAPRFRVVLRSLAATMSAAGLAGLLLTAMPTGSAGAPAAVDRHEVQSMGGPAVGSESPPPREQAPPQSSTSALEEAPAFLIVGGLGLFLLQWGTERAGRPSRRR
jgi:anti-sigma factor RsiW